MGKEQIFAIIIVLFLLTACSPIDTSSDVQTTQESSATLTEVMGTVKVNNKDVEEGASLKQGDKVETDYNSEATITFFDSSIMRLDKGTQIILKNLGTDPKKVVIAQKEGQTWSKLLRIAGISDYRVETPNTVATVRGTAFKIKVGGNTTEVGVGNGVVKVANIKEGKIVSERKVIEDKQVIIEEENIEHEEFVPDEWIEDNIEEDEEFVEEIQERFEEEHEEFIGDLEERGLAEEEVNGWVENFIEGDLTDEEMKFIDEEHIEEFENKEEIEVEEILDHEIKEEEHVEEEYDLYDFEKFEKEEHERMEDF